jgi:hypothetical protein
MRSFGVSVAAVLLLACSSLGQVQVGDNLSLNLNGTVGTDYSAVYGNEIDSSHGLGLGGSAGLTGYYYRPSFLSFNVNPYFNQSRSNSNFGSITDASGVTLSTAIFSGSRTPGSVTYSKSFNSTGNFGLPGLTGFDTTSNSQGFGINWSLLLPNRPTVNVGYQLGSDHYSIFGSNADGSSRFRSLFLNSNYNVAGFGLSGGVSMGASSGSMPQLIVGKNMDTESASHTKSYTFSASHRLPFRGSFSSSINRSNVDSDFLGYRFQGTVDRLASSATVRPIEKLNLSMGIDYTDNLSGALYQAIVPGAQGGTSSGSLAILSRSSQQSSGWNFLSNATYTFARNLQAQGDVERRSQVFEGKTYGSTMYGGGLSYTREILGGYFGSSVTMNESRLDTRAQSILGLSTNTNYNRRIGAWQMGGYFNYAQNVQTLLVSYTTSFYNFSGNVGRDIWRLHWNASAGMGRTLLTAQPGTSNDTKSFSSSIGSHRISVAATYSQADGNSIPSAGGLVQPLNPVFIPSNLLVTYGGTSYALTLSGNPMRNLSASGTFVKARNTLNNQGAASWNNYQEQNFHFLYHFRQVNLTGGYTQLVQGFSASGKPPANVNSFSIGVSRWFNFF